MISTNLNEIFQQSIQYARQMHHEYLTIEHIFYHVLSSEDGAAIISTCGGDIAQMRELLREYIQTQMDSLPEHVKRDPFESEALSRVLDNMIRHIQSAGKSSADIGDLIVALYDEKNTFAYLLLNEFGVSRLDVLEVISHAKTEGTNPSDDTNESFLEKFTINLLKKAKSGKIDPVIGRENEIERAIQILCRRKKNNPILVGEPGVGKTAIAEGLALRIIEEDIPEILAKSELYALDLSAMIAGTKYRGDFEKRLKGVMDELKSHPHAILFIDEIHTLVGAGSTSGSMDAANQLKPALASGEIKCMGATTYAEYRNSFEKDKALSRRFSKIDINEPDEETTFKILKGLKSKYEEHHNVTYSDKALRSAIELSKRYITDRFLPDKAIDVIDECASSLHLKRNPKRKIGPDEIAQSIAKIIGVPVAKSQKEDIDALRELETNLKTRVIGQDHAIKAVSSAIKISKAGLTPPNKPIASFLFLGPTGVGKTELAVALSQTLNIHFEKFDMSEYMEKHALSRLVGAPPGYVGFEQGGLLTEAIRKNPYSVLLLDEIEKAHPDLVNILLQIMDSATLTDNNGYKADFQNVILIMTSNLGATSRSVMGFNKDESLSKNEDLKAFFTPEFRNRLSDTIHFNHLSQAVILGIVDKFINELNRDLEKRKISITLTQEAREYIAQKGYSREMGVRPLKRYIQENITNKLSEEILFGSLQNGGKVQVDADEKLNLHYDEIA